MNRAEAEEYAKQMTYRDAVCNALSGKFIPYRKATLIKLYELLDLIEPEKKHRGRRIELTVMDEIFTDEVTGEKKDG